MTSTILRTNFTKLAKERGVWEAFINFHCIGYILTNNERDMIAICSRIAREISGTDK